MHRFCWCRWCHLVGALGVCDRERNQLPFRFSVLHTLDGLISPCQPGMGGTVMLNYQNKKPGPPKSEISPPILPVSGLPSMNGEVPKQLHAARAPFLADCLATFHTHTHTRFEQHETSRSTAGCNDFDQLHLRYRLRKGF